MPVAYVQSGMLFLIHGSIAAGLLKVTVENDIAIQRHLDPITLHLYFLFIPLAYRPQRSTLCGNDSIDRAVILIRFKLGIHRRSVIEDLYFFTAVGCIALQRSVNPESIVRTWR